jgi:hypothetical protein
LKTLVESQTSDRRELGGAGRQADERLLVELPVAGVEDAAVGRVDEQRVAFGDRVRERDVGDLERAQGDAALVLDDDQLDLVEQPGLRQLVADEVGGERRRVERHAEIRGEVGHRADVVLVRVGEDDAEQAVEPLLNELEVGEHQVDAGVVGIGEPHAEVDHQPLAIAAVEVDVHADLARAAEREEQQFVSGGHAR